MADVLTSEFFWGVVLGVILSIAGAYAGTRFGLRAQNAEFRRRQHEFAREIIGETKKLIEEMDTHRSRARVIHHDFLNMLDVEVSVYGRNRESFILLDGGTRKKLLNFMREVALKQAEIRQYLRQFDDFQKLEAERSAAGDGPGSDEARRNWGAALHAAHEKADKLVTIGKDAPTL